MAKKSRGALITLALVAVMLYWARPLLGCGPFFNVAIYSFDYHPDLPLSNFAAGQLGIVQPGWARSYLFVAYRYLAGPGFDADERKALLSFWMDRAPFPTPGTNAAQAPTAIDPLKPWQDARAKVPGAGDAPAIDVNRSSADDSYSYVNCNDDAFVSAAATLNQMSSKFGAGSSQLKDWLQAQDEVFSDCHSGNAIPAAAPAQMTPLEKAQRDYQIASANFYTGHFDLARQQFDAIGKDPASPWREIAPYLAARTLIRKATLAPKLDNAALGEAESRLKKIAADSPDAHLRSSAQGLLSFIAYRIHPQDRFAALSQVLLKPGSGATLRNNLWDYTLFLDGAPQQNPDDMTDWIVNFQSSDAKSGDYAIKKWQETVTLPWLVAALAKVDAGNPAVSALIDAAAKVKPQSPAYTWLAFYRARLLVQSGKAEPARALLDQVLANGDALPASTRNQLLSLRMQVAANLAELLKYAQRKSAGIINTGDGGEIPSDMSDDKQLADFGSHPSFGPDSTAALNNKLPLATLRAAATAPDLPSNLRRQLQIAAWVRAVILDDRAAADALAPLARDSAPELKGYLQAYIAARTPAQKHYAAIYTLLKLPGLRPFIDPGLGRTTPINKLDDYRDNWWCAKASAGGSASVYVNLGDHPAPVEPVFRPDFPMFLTPAERSAALAQSQQLESQPGPNYLAAQTVAWVKQAPNDPRAPEALHLAVNTTRYGCTGKGTGQFSKQAFDLLHRRYATSPWAAQTKFWFK